MNYTTYCLIHLQNLKENLQFLKNRFKKNTLICCAVKGNAYGHGLVPISQFLIQEGVDRLAVARLEEAEKLRNAGLSCPIHIFSLCIEPEMAKIIALNAIPFISTLEEVELWQKAACNANKKCKVHLKVDIGMGRIGAPLEEGENILHHILAQSHLELEGVGGHFALADEADQTKTKKQIELFQFYIAKWKANNIKLPIVHCSNSAALVCYPESHFDMVRPGIAIYGYSPSEHVKAFFQPLKPILELISHVTLLKKVNANTPISYGGSYITPTETIIATIPIGYADGYSRRLKYAEVVIKNKRYPVVGTICMDQLMVDLGYTNDVCLYDPVILIGNEQDQPSAEELAKKSNTISYEILTNLSERIHRIYKDKN